jgi:hypothetical protein
MSDTKTYELFKKLEKRFGKTIDEDKNQDLLQSLVDKMMDKELKEGSQVVPDDPNVIKILNKIHGLNKRIADIQMGLPYADHGAYGQDLRAIERLQTEKSQLVFRLPEKFRHLA